MKFKVIVILLSLLLTMSAVYAEDNQTLETGTFDDLQKKVDAASDFAVIELSDDYTQGGYPIKIDKDIVIDGKGHVLDGNGGHSLVSCSKGEITLKNMAFKNGYVEGDGGAINVSGSAFVEIINCTFIANSANRGGAISNSGDSVVISDSTFINNSAVLNFGGAILSCSNTFITNCYFEGNTAETAGGAIINSYTPLGVTSIIDSVFINNTAGEDGGAISNSGELRFEGCEFTRNYAEYGGAIWSNRWLTFSNIKSTFIENGAYYGGAIYALSFDSYATNLIFKRNYAKGVGGAVALFNNGPETITNFYFRNCSFEDNYCEKYSILYQGDGGAIYFDTGSDRLCELSIDGCSFSSNHASDSGGAIFVGEGRLYNNPLSFVGSPSYFSSNSAGDDGGAIYACSEVQFNASVNFESNYASSDGGAIYAEADINFFQGPLTFEKNIAVDDGGAIYSRENLYFNDAASYFYENRGANGGAIYVNYVNSIRNAVFKSNHAKSDGGAVYINKDVNVDVKSCLFEYNFCADEGGAIYLDSSSSEISLENNIFSLDSASSGYEVYTCGKFSKINQNWWGSDTPNFGRGMLMEWFVSGSAVRWDSDPLRMRITLYSTKTGLGKSVPVEYSLVSVYGNNVDGEISVLREYSFNHTNLGEFSQAVLNKNAILSNYTPKAVGKHNIMVSGWSNIYGVLTVDESSNPDNVIQIIESNLLTFTDLQNIIDNAAPGSVIDLENDFAYYMRDYVRGMKGIIIDKDLVIDGHGHFIDAQDASRIFYSTKGTITLRNLLLKDGYGYEDDDGGAIYIKSDAKYIIANCEFDYNWAYQDGGAIFNDGGELKIQNSSFNFNLASGANFLNDCDGGAIHSKAHLIIDNCTFRGNMASDNGGAIYAPGGLTIENTPSHFISNWADTGDGGAIHTSKFNKDVKYATFVSNRGYSTVSGVGGDGGAIYIDDENHVTFESCCFIDNKCNDEGGAIYVDDMDSELSLINNIFVGNEINRRGSVAFNCGKYLKVRNNWWGEDCPEFNNVLVEWHAIGSNEDHYDEDPLRAIFKLGSTHACVDSNLPIEISLYSVLDGSISPKLTGLENFIFMTENAGTFSNYTYGPNSIKAIYTPQKLGTHRLDCDDFFNKYLRLYLYVDDDSTGPDGKEQIIQNTDLTFTQFQTIVNDAPDGSVIDLNSNVYFNELNDNEGIIINKNLVINGHDHFFDAQSASGIFQSSQGSITLNDIVFKNGNQVSADDGGAIRILGSAKYTILNCTFDSNKALQDGGAIYNEGGNLAITHSTFINNRAEGANMLNDCDGGAIHSKAPLTINYCTFKNNYAGDNGGAIYASNGLTIVENPSAFESNTAYNGKGGAIYANIFNKDVKYAVFFNNSAGEGATIGDDGGAIYINNKNTVSFSQCAFIINHCSDEGGAIYLDSTDSHLTLRNNYFLGNSAGDEGQIVFNKGHFDSISDNWWADNLPSKDNDLLIEWEPIFANDHHVDSNPVYMKMDLTENICPVNSSVWATVCFYHYKDGSLCDGKMYVDLISFMPSSDIVFFHRINHDYYVNIMVEPQKEGLYILRANLYGQFASALLFAYAAQSEELAGASGEAVNVSDEDISVSGEAVNVSDEDISVSGEAVSVSGDGHDSHDGDEAIGDNVNQFGDNKYLGYGNGSHGEISNDSNLNITASKDSRTNSVAKTIDSNISSINFPWILLLILIVAGIVVLIWKKNKSEGD